MIINCNCKSQLQDKLYGTGKRIANKTNKGVRCTVCSTETVIGEEKKAKK